VLIRDGHKKEISERALDNRLGKGIVWNREDFVPGQLVAPSLGGPAILLLGKRTQIWSMGGPKNKKKTGGGRGAPADIDAIKRRGLKNDKGRTNGLLPETSTMSRQDWIQRNRPGKTQV